MTDDLDPDQRACPYCHAPPGQVCRDRNGRKARKIHASRRDASAHPGRVGRPFTPGNRAGDKGRQAANRRRAEAAAKREAKREQLAAQAIEDEAERIARDAHAYEGDRVKLRRQVLDTTRLAWTRAEESLRGLQRPILDDDGRPNLRAREYETPSGQTRYRLEPDVVGAYKADDVVRLVTAAALALDKVRLEEGEATASIRHTGNAAPSLTEALGVEQTRELLERALDLSHDLDAP